MRSGTYARGVTWRIASCHAALHPLLPCLPWISPFSPSACCECSRLRLRPGKHHRSHFCAAPEPLVTPKPLPRNQHSARSSESGTLVSRPDVPPVCDSQAGSRRKSVGRKATRCGRSLGDNDAHLDFFFLVTHGWKLFSIPRDSLSSIFPLSPSHLHKQTLLRRYHASSSAKDSLPRSSRHFLSFSLEQSQACSTCDGPKRVSIHIVC